MALRLCRCQTTDYQRDREEGSHSGEALDLHTSSTDTPTNATLTADRSGFPATRPDCPRCAPVASRDAAPEPQRIPRQFGRSLVTCTLCLSVPGPSCMGETAGMTHPVDRALRLWSEPLSEGEDALLAFRLVYVDPLEVNGAQTALRELVDRARMLQRALAGLQAEILERFDTPERSAFAFRLSGVHVGRLTTPLGDVAPTGQPLHLLGMDIVAIRQDRVSAVWAITDYLGLLIRANAVNLANP
jgi:hypothetical protein